jgi:hypothetical protein
MKKYVCLVCSASGFTNGKYQKYCPDCSKDQHKVRVKEWGFRNGILNGLGSGGKLGSENQNYRHGISVFRRWAKERLKNLNYCCERCGNYIDASVRGTWAGHHKDHNRQNNIKENLEVLCKRCHQIEHECWRALQGVTTIPKGSTLETVEAHSPEKSGDDIV